MSTQKRSVPHRNDDLLAGSVEDFILAYHAYYESIPTAPPEPGDLIEGNQMKLSAMIEWIRADERRLVWRELHDRITRKPENGGQQQWAEYAT